MRYSRFFMPTYREVPSEAEVVSHQLMLRAGLIRKLTSGIYTYLPAGLRAIRKVETIVREEMNRSGGVEILMSAVQPAELWRETGRWDYYGRELLRFKDRHDRDVCFGPTHEEVITDLVRNEIRSYRQLPVNFYQIQTKFRDEVRPRFGLMRAREFIMKDAYSFDEDDKGAEQSYEIMYEAYERIFRRCGLEFRAVEADTGAIGGSYSHEFMVIAETGEDQIVSCKNCSYAANLEKAEVAEDEHPAEPGATDMNPVDEVITPDVTTVGELTDFLSIIPSRLVKTLLVKADQEVVAVLVRGDHELNESKVRSFLGAQGVELADEEVVRRITGAPVGFAGPVGLKVRIVADQAVKGMKDFVTGGNRKDLHLMNVNLGRDFKVSGFGDLRMITSEDACPRCGRELHFGRGIEVGHIFKLGTKYSHPLGAYVLNEKGQEIPIVMGCYGIGIGRTVAAAIEQCHDEKGIVWPVPISPFEVIVLPLQMHENVVVETAEKIYVGLLELGVDVLLDDRNERAGVKFNDADLLGFPVRVTVGRRGLERGEVEVKLRHQAEGVSVPIDDALDVITGEITRAYDSIR